MVGAALVVKGVLDVCRSRRGRKPHHLEVVELVEECVAPLELGPLHGLAVCSWRARGHTSWGGGRWHGGGLGKASRGRRRRHGCDGRHGGKGAGGLPRNA